jgi:hypothetical protein
MRCERAQITDADAIQVSLPFLGAMGPQSQQKRSLAAGRGPMEGVRQERSPGLPR